MNMQRRSKPPDLAAGRNLIRPFIALGLTC